MEFEDQLNIFCISLNYTYFQLSHGKINAKSNQKYGYMTLAFNHNIEWSIFPIWLFRIVSSFPFNNTYAGTCRWTEPKASSHKCMATIEGPIDIRKWRTQNEQATFRSTQMIIDILLLSLVARFSASVFILLVVPYFDIFWHPALIDWQGRVLIIYNNDRDNAEGRRVLLLYPLFSASAAVCGGQRRKCPINVS